MGWKDSHKGHRDLLVKYKIAFLYVVFYIIIDFITEAAGRWKFEHRPQLPPGPDSGHACLRA